MCKNHDQLHYDPELRAIASTLAGMQRAETDEWRRKCANARDLLLSQCTAHGLLEYVQSNPSSFNSSELNRLRVKLLAVTQRLQSEALDLLRRGVEADDERPF